MVAQVLPFLRRPEPRVRDWTQQELAEFYRVESALVQAGVELESDRGVSDEGDPWFIFCRADTGDVFIHFARIDGMYVVDGAAFDRPARGPDFSALVRQLIGHYPLAKMRETRAPNVFVHPAALLIALVGAAFFNSGDAKAAETTDAKEAPRRTSLIVTGSSGPAIGAAAAQSAYGDPAAQAAAVILSAVLTLNGDLFSLVRESSQATALVVFDPPTEAARLAAPPAAQSDASAAAPPPAELAAAAPGPAAPQEVPAPGEGARRVAPPSGLPGADPEAAWTPPAAEEPPTLSFPPPAAAPPTGGAKPLFLGKAASLPSGLDAVELLAAADGAGPVLLELMTKGLVLVDRLPVSLIEVIRRGEHVDLSGPDLAPDAPAIPIPAAPGVVLPPLDGGAEPLTPPLAGPRSARDAQIDAAIAAFVAQVDHLQIIMQGERLVLFDEDIFGPFAGNLNLTSVTFTFEDGSSVSLVGTADDLAAFSWAA